MCTLTYLPTGDRKFILTSNRDESPKRAAATNPQIRNVEGQQILYPQDGHAHGTWIATGEQGRTVVLLNGAFERHKHRPPYRKSRGIVLLDSFKHDTVKDFADNYDLEGIEPFTLVVFDVNDHLLISEVRWDEQQVHYAEVDPSDPHIWSSATLYSPEVRQKREEWFGQWLDGHDTYSAHDIRKFHHFGGEGNDRIDIKMNWDNKVQTVSITSLQVEPSKATWYYEDLLDGQDLEISLDHVR